MSAKKMWAIIGCLMIAGMFGGWIGQSAEAAEAEYVLKLGHSSAPVSIRQQMCEKFAEEAAEMTNGALEIRIFPASQLGKMRDMIDNLRVGTVHIVVDPPSRLSVYTKIADIFKMPYVIRSREHGEKVWESPIGQELFDRLAEDAQIVPIAMQWRGARHLYATKMINSLEDVEGLKIRVPPYDPPLTTWKVLGANPVGMPYKEIYLAMQQGVVEAQENPLELVYTSGFSEIIECVVLTGHVREFNGFMMGTKYLNGLPDDIREALVKAAKSAAKYGGDLVQDSEKKYLQKFRDDGIEIIEVDQAEWEKKLEEWKYSYNDEITPIMRKIEAME
ncbi:DctP family TRAP transporter solute-binding subunit [candidate division KSB3 bacterium]|uniref:DctP family TRAP transporter solute-binding subunit n=1 Tax=candidate division KSB3 bacterium TaxID=2044937 RepID=A0A9D5JU60_9BACT|nr:DctP family TRAP transporter solute-binding subunit [candidate division KSB3 bacterium]MBD3324169.1 DctP family TRAP transporter solute-binding subunit [candidate division KSB3 bacterium]